MFLAKKRVRTFKPSSLLVSSERRKIACPLGKFLPLFTALRFFCELRRRKVYRVAAAYAVAGWLIIQFAVAVFPVLSLPAWVTRLAVFFVLGNFPIALVLGWAFDIGPTGIQVTPEPEAGAECLPAYSGRRKNLFALGLTGLTISAALGYFLFARSSAH